MTKRYTYRDLEVMRDPTKPRSLSITMLKLSRGLGNTKGPWQLEYSGEIHRKLDSRYETVRRVSDLMRGKGPDRVIVRPTRGHRHAVRELEYNPTPPVPDGPGTVGIDKIHAAVLVECKRRGWRVAELGICVNKPGEHGYCNAWDGGCLRANDGGTLSDDVIHYRITAIGEWIMYQGKMHENSHGERGLPVNGVIVMYKYWERGNDTWRPYYGTPHVTHWHVSAYPSRTGWV